MEILETKKDDLCQYEISFIERREEENVVKKILEGNGTSFLNEEPVVKIKLSYPIKKEQFGFFGVINFLSEKELIPKINSSLKLEDNILRYSIRSSNSKVKQDADFPLEKKEEKRKMTRRIFTKKTERKQQFGTLSNEALEKKIEEILQ